MPNGAKAVGASGSSSELALQIHPDVTADAMTDLGGRGCSLRPVLDPCSGSRMFWFDRSDHRAVFGDIRSESHTLKDRSSAGGSRELVIRPDMLLDFRSLPFEDETFHLVVFDPPHLIRNGKTGWLAKKYGKLGEDWREDIRSGFSECFRVLKSNGTLIFKWNEHDIRVSEVLKLTPERPLFGNRCGKTAKSHWIVFMKPDGNK